MTGAVAGPDGKLRCPWGLSAPEYIAYHDKEWGRRIRTDKGLYERMTLEAFQSGLSWLTILRKREGFRKAFGGFELETVAAYGPDDVERLLADVAIVRNRAKIEAAIRNANAALKLEGGLAKLLWSFAPDAKGRPAPKTLGDVPPLTDESKAMAKELKRRGFAFVGPTTAYALMQAAGLVDDHLVDCHARRKEK